MLSHHKITKLSLTMGRIFIAVIAICLISEAFGHGKQPIAPRLSPAVLAALHPAPLPIVTPPELQVFKTCLPGYHMQEDNTCVKTIEEPAFLACPEGRLVNGHCEVEIPHVLTCPLGYKLDDEKCTRIMEVGLQFYCPLGFYDDGNACAQEVPGEAVIQCDIGELIGDHCVIRERKEHLIRSECPEGSFLLEDGNCWKHVETFDCTHEPEEHATVLAVPRENMPLGRKVVVSKGKTARFRCLHGFPAPIPAPLVVPLPPPIVPPPPPPIPDPNCGTEMISVSAPQPTRINVVSQVCSKKVQVDAIAIVSCPPEYFDNGSFCEKEILSPPTTICVSGDLRNGVCQPAVRRVPKYPGCPPNAYAVKGKCWKQDCIDPLKSCPKGFLESGEFCLGYVESPGYECPDGLELIGNKCVGEMVRPAIDLTVGPEVCPPGTVF